MAVTVETHETLTEAARALGQGGNYLGGGTVLMRGVNAGEVQGRIVRSRDPALRGIAATGDGLRVGAGTTMAEILASRDAAFLHPVAAAIGGPQVRAMATVGGNLFAYGNYGDFAAALLALGATVTLAGSGGRGISIDDFLRDRDRYATSLVQSVTVPRPRDQNAQFDAHSPLCLMGNQN